MTWRKALVVFLMCVGGAAGGRAQGTAQAPFAVPAQAESDGLDPEEGFLSPTRYTNTFFGFEFDIPATAELKPVPAPASLDRRIQLLEMVGRVPQHTALSICAYEYKGKNYTDAKGILRQQLNQELFTGVEELHGLSKTSIDGRQFYYFETRRGAEQHIVLAAEMNGYVLEVTLQANDSKIVKDLSAAFYRLKFFPSAEARQYAGPNASPYEGPAVSSQRLREIRAAAPAEHMDPGKVEGNTYRNEQIGMVYEFPKGWSIKPQGAIEPAVIRYREKVTGEPALGPRERAVVKACRRTLLSVWRTEPGTDGEVSYGDFGEVTLSAMSAWCFPNIRFPDDPHDVDAMRRFVVGLSFTQPLQREMNDARSYEAGGKAFVLTHGTIAYKEDGEALSRRISVAMAITQQHGYLLIWLFAAPHDAELRELMSAKVGFDPEPKSAGSSSAKNAGGGVQGASQGGPAAVAPVAKGAAEEMEVESSVPAKSTSGDPRPPATASAAANPSQTPFHPSLVREGEDQQGQQVQGKPVPNKKPD